MRYCFLIIVLLFTAGTSACGPGPFGGLFPEPTPTPPNGFTNLYDLTPPEQFLKRPALSADGHILAAIGGISREDTTYGQIFVIDTENNQVLYSTGEKAWISLALSFDGKRIAACSEEQTSLIDWEIGTTTFLTNGCWPTWSPDSTQIAYVFYTPESNQIKIRDLATNSEKLIYEYPSSTAFMGELAWSPTGNRLAFTTHDLLADNSSTSLNIINIDGSGFQNITGASQYVVSPHFSPDGNKLLYVDWSRLTTIRVIDVEGQCHQLESPKGLRTVALSSDGNKIALSTIYGLLVADTEAAFGQDFWVSGKLCNNS